MKGGEGEKGREKNVGSIGTPFTMPSSRKKERKKKGERGEGEKKKTIFPLGKKKKGRKSTQEKGKKKKKRKTANRVKLKRTSKKNPTSNLQTGEGEGKERGKKGEIITIFFSRKGELEKREAVALSSTIFVFWEKRKGERKEGGERGREGKKEKS